MTLLAAHLAVFVKEVDPVADPINEPDDADANQNYEAPKEPQADDEVKHSHRPIIPESQRPRCRRTKSTGGLPTREDEQMSLLRMAA